MQDADEGCGRVQSYQPSNKPSVCSISRMFRNGGPGVTTLEMVMERGGSGMSNMESVTNKENEADNSVHQR